MLETCTLSRQCTFTTEAAVTNRVALTLFDNLLLLLLGPSSAKCLSERKSVSVFALTVATFVVEHWPSTLTQKDYQTTSPGAVNRIREGRNSSPQGTERA